MNIDKFEAGRELDALVWLALNGKKGEKTSQGILGCRYVDGDIQPHAGYPIGHISPPNYSTSIAAVLEDVPAMDAEMDLGYSPDPAGLEWDCSFGLPRSPSEKNCVYADTASLAVSLAILKYYG